MMLVVRAIVLLAAVVGCFCQTDSCLRFGGGACCPQVNRLDRSLQDIAAEQPWYVVFVAKSDERSTIDNVCYTFFPLPDDPNTYTLYLSRVFNDSYNDVTSYIVSQPELGILKHGRGLCMFTDTVFARLECDRDVYVDQRCATFGDCDPIDLSDINSGVVAFSNTRRPISKACLNRGIAAVSNNGLPEDDFIILPMNLPSRCVLNQVCTITSAVQRFCQTVGVAFPAVNRCYNQYY